MKKKSLQKISRLFASAALVGTMCLGSVASVNAANGEPNKWTESQEAKAAITVEYKMGKSVDTPANTVSFVFDKVNGPVQKSDMPDITVANVNFPAKVDEVLASDSNDIKVLRKQSNNFLASFKTAMDTSDVMTTGEYQYTVHSTSSVSKNKDADEFKASDAVYNLSIFVAQNSQGKLYIKGLGITQKFDDGGSAGSSTKIDGTPGNGTGSTEGDFSALKFVNVYTAKAGNTDPDTKPDPDKKDTYAFKVSNTTEGNTDEAGNFTYTMTVNKPTGFSTKDNTFVYYVNGKEKTGTYGAALEFTLDNAQNMMIKSCYAGSTVSVNQAGRANWTATAVQMFDGKAEAQLSAAMGKDLAASGILGQKENKVDYTNTYKDIAVTGIIVNNFPFIIMIGMAIVAFAGIVVMNSKKRMNRR